MSNDLSHLALNQLSTFVTVLSPDGIVVEVNQTLLVASGLALEDVAGRLAWETPWWRRNPAVQDLLRSAVHRAGRGETVRFDVPMQVRAEEPTWIDFQLSALRDAAGTVIHLVGSGSDITARRDAEAALRESHDRLAAVFSSIDEGLTPRSLPDRGRGAAIIAGLALDVRVETHSGGTTVAFHVAMQPKVQR